MTLLNHDSAKQGQSSSYNFTIDYIIKFGDWGSEREKMIDLQNKLSKVLYYSIENARHKTLAHNDLKTFNYGVSLGAFPEGRDKEYFSLLQDLVNAVSDKWLNSKVFPFNDLAASDVDEFLHVLGKA